MNPSDTQAASAPRWPLSLHAAPSEQAVVVDATGRSMTLAEFQDDCRRRADALRRESMLGFRVGFGWRAPRRADLAAT